MRCLLNPNRKQSSNQFIDAKIKGNPKPCISEFTREKIASKLRDKPLSKERKDRLSEVAKNRNFGGTTQSKWIEYNGVKLGSSYELQLAKNLDENGIKWERKGKLKSGVYVLCFPVLSRYFYLTDFNLFLDPKNDFLLQNVNPSLGFSDCEKIKLVEEQNKITVIILSKKELKWEVIEKMIRQSSSDGRAVDL